MAASSSEAGRRELASLDHPSQHRAQHPPAGFSIGAADDAVAPKAAYRTARILALLTLRDAPMQLDAEAITRSLEDLTRQVDCVRGLKTKLTAIGSTAREVSDALDLLRGGVLRSVKELEAQLAVVEPDASSLTA